MAPPTSPHAPHPPYTPRRYFSVGQYVGDSANRRVEMERESQAIFRRQILRVGHTGMPGS